MSDTDLAPALEKLLLQLEHSSRLEFLYKAVEDTQNTIRFIDTKAAFCVTLLSGMAAGVLQGHRAPHTDVQKALLAVFIAAVALSLLVCLRVIFPVIKPHSDHSAAYVADDPEVLHQPPSLAPLASPHAQQLGRGRAVREPRQLHRRADRRRRPGPADRDVR